MISRSALSLLLGLVALGASACETGTSTEELTITGIVVRAEPLTRGTGCGTKPGQVFKYAAVTTRANTAIVVDAGLYDCFADAAFVNLPSDGQGSFDFNVHIFAFDKPRHDAQLGAINTALGRDGSGIPSGALDGLKALSALGGTLCSVRQELTVQSVAACEPLR